MFSDYADDKREQNQKNKKTFFKPISSIPLQDYQEGKKEVKQRKLVGIFIKGYREVSSKTFYERIFAETLILNVFTKTDDNKTLPFYTPL